MKLILCLTLSLLSVGVAADVSDLKITSFILLGQTTITSPRLGEVCGSVSGDLPAMVTIVSDPNYKPGSYTTLTDAAGRFCHTLATYTGRVEASATSLHGGHPSAVKSSSASVK
jgi:hypothetical protein